MKVTSFEISKKLKELGVDLESIFVYSVNKDTYFYTLEELEDATEGDYNLGIDCNAEYVNDEYECKAYTLEDILDVLPRGFYSRETGGCKWFKINDSMLMGYGIEARVKKKDNETLADTAARLLINLIEDKVIIVDEVNNERSK